MSGRLMERRLKLVTFYSLVREMVTYCCLINATLNMTQEKIQTNCAPAVVTTVCLCTGRYLSGLFLHLWPLSASSEGQMVKDSLPAEKCSASLCEKPVDMQSETQNGVYLNLDAFEGSGNSSARFDRLMLFTARLLFLTFSSEF